MTTKSKPKENAALELACIVVIFALVLLFSGAMQGTILLTEQSQLNDENAGWLMSVPGLRQLTLFSNKLRSQNQTHFVALRVRDHKVAYSIHTEPMEEYWRMERGIIPDDALELSGPLGRGYWIPDLVVLDYYGLVDKVVARTPVNRSNRDRRIAHDRSPTIAYVKERRPNFKVFPPEAALEDALRIASYAVEVAPGLWMPFQAVNGIWAAERFDGHNFHTLASHLEPMPVTYDRGLSLEGFAIGQGFHQLRRPFVLDPAEESWFVARWRTAPGVEFEFVFSLRLYGAGGERRFQFDDLIRHPAVSTTTHHWPADEVVDQRAWIELPADIPSGDYELRLVVYDFDSGDVTAELDSWRNEITLATVRLRD